MEVGKVITQSNYSSSSTDSHGFDFAGKNNINITIEGKNGVDISEYSQNPLEKEVLFARETKFIVESITKNKLGAVEIKMKELEEKGDSNTDLKLTKIDDVYGTKYVIKVGTDNLIFAPLHKTLHGSKYSTIKYKDEEIGIRFSDHLRTPWTKKGYTNKISEIKEQYPDIYEIQPNIFYIRQSIEDNNNIEIIDLNKNMQKTKEDKVFYDILNTEKNP